uniref:C-type lectin domain-containing protein n=1 Tax=Scophthalmus maximus TaxID=52904 RepID=A0A8D3E8K6_SCOMX
MKAVLLLTVLLSGVLAITAAAVEAVEPAQAPLELQEENQVAEIEVGVAAPEVEAPEKSGEMALSVKGRFFACPTGWVRYKNSCYLYVSTGKSWSSAAAHCDSLGATLASVKNVFDYSFLQDLTRRAGSTVAWMGGFYFQGWRWVDQSIFNYNFWSSQNSVRSYQCMYLNARGKTAFPSDTITIHYVWSSCQVISGLYYLHTLLMDKHFLFQLVGLIITAIMAGRPSA